jgi:hypothetical protein
VALEFGCDFPNQVFHIEAKFSSHRRTKSHHEKCAWHQEPKKLQENDEKFFNWRFSFGNIKIFGRGERMKVISKSSNVSCSTIFMKMEQNFTTSDKVLIGYVGKKI